MPTSRSKQRRPAQPAQGLEVPGGYLVNHLVAHAADSGSTSSRAALTATASAPPASPRDDTRVHAQHPALLGTHDSGVQGREALQRASVCRSVSAHHRRSPNSAWRPPWQVLSRRPAEGAGDTGKAWIGARPITNADDAAGTHPGAGRSAGDEGQLHRQRASGVDEDAHTLRGVACAPQPGRGDHA